MSQSKGIDILPIHETKLHSTIKDNKVHLPENDVVRKDRENNGRNGGGICIYVRLNINFHIRADFSPSNIECLAIEITTETPIQATPCVHLLQTTAVISFWPYQYPLRVMVKSSQSSYSRSFRGLLITLMLKIWSYSCCVT